MYKYDSSLAAVCTYDPSVDRNAVDQVGFLDIRKAFESGLVDSDFTVASESFNGVDDPSTLLPRPKDQFEAMRQADYVKSAIKSAKESKTPSVTPTNVGEN